MCGIAGVYDGSSAPDRADLERMADSLYHRGPDEGGVYRDGPVGLAHRRLRVVGIDSGRQPVFNEDGSVAVVFNGEVYNHERLRADLRRRGHRFSTDTDTEVLVHAYEEHGPSFVERLDGMFAFALWDGEAQRLFLARDPMGIKPLFVGVDDGRVAFASELPALFELGFDFGGLDRTAVAEYFAFGFVPAPRTPFRTVSKLRPGERLVVSAGGIERTPFYTPSVAPVDADFDAAAATLRALVEDAVEARLQADVPLGAFLSGGIDSSVLTGVLSSVADGTVETYSVGFRESRFDERWAAREVAERHGTDHHEFLVTPAETRAVIDDVVPALGEPFADPSILPTFVVARETSRDLTVALSGDGADELFSGYEKYRGEYCSSYYRALPKPVRKTLVEPAVNGLPASRTTRRGDAVRKARKFVRGAPRERAARQYEWMAVTTGGTGAALRGVDPEARGIERLEREQRAAAESLPAERRDSLGVMQMVDARFALPDGILTKADRASMLNSLEVRVPFLDPAVFEFAAGLPTSFSITRGERKRILKRAFEDVLPADVEGRGKQGFDVPIGEWFRDELSEEFESALRSTETDLVDVDAVRGIYDEHCRGRRDHARFLWSVYVFVRWHDAMVTRGVL